MLPSCRPCCRQVAPRCLLSGFKSAKMPSWSHVGGLRGPQNYDVLQVFVCFCASRSFAVRSRKIAQEGPKMVPRWPQDGPKRAPRGPQDCPKTAPRRLFGFKFVLRWPQLSPSSLFIAIFVGHLVANLLQEASEEGFRPSRCHLVAILAPFWEPKRNFSLRLAVS